MSESVANAAAPGHVGFVKLGEVNLKGFAKPVGVRSPPHLNGCLDPLADGSIPESAYAGSNGIDHRASGPEEPRDTPGGGLSVTRRHEICERRHRDTRSSLAESMRG